MKLAGSQYTRVGPDFPEGKTWILASVARGKPEKDPESVVQWKQKMRGGGVSGVLKEDFRMGGSRKNVGNKPRAPCQQTPTG